MGSTVQLTFSNFITEATNDFVNVYEGSVCAPSSRWVQLSGQPSQSKLNYSSVGNVLTIELITDGISEFSGFNASYMTTTSTTVATTTFQSLITSEPPTSKAPTTQPPTAIILTPESSSSKGLTIQPPTVTSEPSSSEAPTTQPPTAIVTTQIHNADKEIASRMPVVVHCIVISVCWALNFLLPP